MTSLYCGIVASVPCLVFAAALMPARQHGNALNLQRGVPWLVAASFALALMAATCLVQLGPLDHAFVRLSPAINLGVYFDSLAAVMLVLISFIGWIIARYSARYLNGEPNQGAFLRRLCLTLGAVMLMVVSRNLLMLTAAWMLTSFGLHKLLLFYPERPWAVWAARKKFLISRIGDVFLLGALGLTYVHFGSFDYRDLFAAAAALGATTSGGFAFSCIGLLFALGAMTKSAQFPFHSWLPDTLETPTPVSALMHAGVINAGGFLVIRLSPLVCLSHLALDLLALVGGFTALFAAVVMLTQTSIKRTLAWSTVAQMGFMMLQCGLGAFSAALLHIVAHSLYKAHAFLTSGSVIEAAARSKSDVRTSPRGPLGWSLVPLSLLMGVGLITAVAWLLGIELASKPGIAVLGLVMAIALAQLIWPSLATGSAPLAARGVSAAVLVCGSYLIAYLAFDWLLAGVVPHVQSGVTVVHAAVLGSVGAGFGGVFLLQATVPRAVTLSAMRTLYVHAANGFYLDVPARRLTAAVWRCNSPTP